MSLKSNLQEGRTACPVALFWNPPQAASLCLPLSLPFLPEESSDASLHHIDCTKTRLKVVKDCLAAYLFIVLFDPDRSTVHRHEQVWLSLKYSKEVVHFSSVYIDLYCIVFASIDSQPLTFSRNRIYCGVTCWVSKFLLISSSANSRFVRSSPPYTSYVNWPYIAN